MSEISPKGKRVDGLIKKFNLYANPKGNQSIILILIEISTLDSDWSLHFTLNSNHRDLFHSEREE